MLDDLLRNYYESGDPESLRKILLAMRPIINRLLPQCVADFEISKRIWARTIQKVRLGHFYRDWQFDLSRGKASEATRGFVVAIALHYACRWLVWYEHPDTIVD